MAVLTDQERIGIWAQWQRDNTVTTGPMTKPDLRAAINAIDDWVDQNAASFNSAIPQPARSALTAKQKAWLLFYVVRRRFETSNGG